MTVVGGVGVAPRTIAFIVNPIAGMGGSVGLKGTDGNLDEAIARGAEPRAVPRALEFCRQLAAAEKTGPSLREVRWLVPGPPMGEEVMELAGLGTGRRSVIHAPMSPSRQADTMEAARKAMAGSAELILFCGGDGTARDILEVVGTAVPILGIPAGVKMHSGVFAATPQDAARAFVRYAAGELTIGESEVLDLDEEAYRAGDWKIRLQGIARCPQDPNLIPCGKMNIEEMTDEEVKWEIALYLADKIREDREGLCILGPGSTMAALAKALDVPKTLLGIDVVRGGRLLKADVNAKDLESLLTETGTASIYVSPLGAQGFVLGRGNLQITASLLRRIGMQRIVVAATPAKLLETPTLRIDTGDPSLDKEFTDKGYLPVVIGDLLSRMVPVARPAPDG